MHASERSSSNGKVLCINGYRLSVDLSCSDNHSVSGKVFLLHAKLTGIVLDEQVVLIECSLIEELSDTFSCRKLSHCNLLCNRLVPSTLQRMLGSLLQFGNFFTE